LKIGFWQRKSNFFSAKLLIFLNFAIFFKKHCQNPVLLTSNYREVFFLSGKNANPFSKNCKSNRKGVAKIKYWSCDVYILAIICIRVFMNERVLYEDINRQ